MDRPVVKLLRALRCGGRLFAAVAVAALLTQSLARGATSVRPFGKVDWNAVLRADQRVTFDAAQAKRAGAPYFYIGNAAFGVVATYGIIVGDVGGYQEDVAAVPLQRFDPPVITGYLIYTEASPRHYVTILSGRHISVAIRDLRLIQTSEADPRPPPDVRAKTYTVYTVAANRFTPQWSETIACRPPPAAGQLLFCRFYPYNDNANVSRAQIARAFFALRDERISTDFASARAVTTRQRPVGEVVFYRGALYAYGVSFTTGTFTMRTIDSLSALQ